MNNYILEYYQKMQDGSIIVGRWINLLYTYIIKGLEDRLFYFDQKKANKAIKFIENFCHHSEGALAPGLITLELWQKAFVSVVFGIVDEKGLRVFREVVLVVARKNGKTLFASAIMAYCAYLDGEYGAKIFCVAPKLDQADLVYSAFKSTVELEPELDNITKSRKTDLYIAETKSSVKKIAFNEKKSDGFNPSLTVADEFASWPAAQGLKQYDVMKSALGAREQPLILAISTAGYVNDGIYDELMKRSTRFLMGNSKETRLCPFLYMVDDVNKWNDINELRKSNPNLGVSVKVDYYLEEIAVAEQSLPKKAEFMTKYCCIKQNNAQAWLDSNVIEAASEKTFTLDDFRSSYCVGGIDLSQTTDLTACLVGIERDKELYVFAKFFMPAEKLEEATARDGIPYHIYVSQGDLILSGDNFVDYKDCFNWFRSLVEEYEILPLKTGYDRYSAQYLVQDMERYGFHMDDVYQGDNLWGVIQETEGMMKDGRIHIGQNQLLKAHLFDSAIKMNVERGRGRLIKLDPRKHIDGTAALLDMMCVRQKYHDQIGQQLRNEE